MKSIYFYCLGILCLLAIPADISAQDEKKGPDWPEDEPVITEHSIRIGDQTVEYQVETGYLTLEKEDGEARARIFYMAYTLQDKPEASQRPITFSFNGGPGSSSVWLHLGVLGPRRVLMGEEGEPLEPPYELVDNAYSWLDLTDMVFIDPVSTGFSRAPDRKSASQFHGVEGDIESVGEFIRRYLSKEDRWASPKYVIGESYGTTRAAGLADHLSGRFGMYLNGVILVSAITNFQTARFDPGNDLPYMMFLPTYAAAAHYHGMLESPHAEMEQSAFLEEVRRFAKNEYNLALMEGDELPESRRTEIIGKLADYTGLSETWLDRANMRINIHRFTKELMREERKVIGRFDARYTGIDMDANGTWGERDPSYQPTIQGCFSTMINDYVGRELNFDSKLPYEVLTGRVRPWDYGGAENRYLNTADRLRGAMERNPSMRIWIANGIYDLATPFFATEYTLTHMGLSPEVREQVSMTYYPAGHMMYLQLASLKKMKEEAKVFYQNP